MPPMPYSIPDTITYQAEGVSGFSESLSCSRMSPGLELSVSTVIPCAVSTVFWLLFILLCSSCTKRLPCLLRGSSQPLGSHCPWSGAHPRTQNTFPVLTDNGNAPLEPAVGKGFPFLLLPLTRAVKDLQVGWT